MRDYSDGDSIVVKNQGSVGASELSDRHCFFFFFPCREIELKSRVSAEFRRLEVSDLSLRFYTKF